MIKILSRLASIAFNTLFKKKNWNLLNYIGELQIEVKSSLTNREYMETRVLANMRIAGVMQPKW